MILAVYGADQLSVKRRIDQLKQEVDGGAGLGPANTNLIEGRAARPDDILGPALAAPFLAPMRLVLVDGLIDRFEPQQGDRRPRSTDMLEPLFAALENGLPETTALVFSGTVGDARRNPFLTRLARLAGASIEHYPEPKRDALPRFIKEEAASRGMKLDSASVQSLASITGSNTLMLANEIEKLSLYTMGRPVTQADVAAVCSGDRQARIYEYTDSLFEGDVAKALDALPFVYRSGETPEGVMAIVLTELRRTAIVAELLEAGEAPAEIGIKAKISQDWMVRRAIERARRFGTSGVRQAYSFTIEADRSNKTGTAENEVAVDVLTARIAALANSRTSRGAR